MLSVLDPPTVSPRVQLVSPPSHPAPSSSTQPRLSTATMNYRLINSEGEVVSFQKFYGLPIQAYEKHLAGCHVLEALLEVGASWRTKHYFIPRTPTWVEDWSLFEMQYHRLIGHYADYLEWAGERAMTELLIRDSVADTETPLGTWIGWQDLTYVEKSSFVMEALKCPARSAKRQRKMDEELA